MVKQSKALTAYSKRRRFNKTPEPPGTVKVCVTKRPLFVVQFHKARALHYDFRIEVAGVLKSWAVPKGFSTNPAIKHLAVPTDDHPMDYATFEGVIPSEEYGAGPVMVWDKGTYKNMKKDEKGILVPMEKCLRLGRVELFLRGKKLKGGYALIRTARKAGDRYWLLIKMNDAYAHAPIAHAHLSVKTGRTMQEIAARSKS